MSKNNEKYCYLQFPLCLLQKTFGTKEEALNAINVIIGFGIMNYGLKLEIPDNEICQQIVYNYFNYPEILSGP